MVNSDNLGFAIGVGGEIEDFAILGAFGEQVFAVAGYGGNAEAFHHGIACRAIAIDHIVHRTLVAFAEHRYEEQLLAVCRTHKTLFLHLGNHHRAVATEDDNVVHARAFARHLHSLFAFQTPPHKTCLVVHIQFLVGQSHLRSLDVVEVADFGLALTSFAIFFQDVVEIADGIVGEMS